MAKPPTLKQRLAAGKRALRDAELRIAAQQVDEAEAKYAALASAKADAANDGSVLAVVLFGGWMRDAATEEEGPGVACQIVGGGTVTALISHDDSEALGPDLAPGDHVRIRRTSTRRYAYLRTERQAKARKPCNWVRGWKHAHAPELAAVGMGA